MHKNQNKEAQFLFGFNLQNYLQVGIGHKILVQEVEKGSLNQVFPELIASVGLSGGPYHAETVFEHLIAALKAAEKDLIKIDNRFNNWILRLGVLLHDIGKPVVRSKDGKSFHKHEVVGAEIAWKCCSRWGYGSEVANHVSKLVRYHMWRFEDDTRDTRIRRWLLKVGEKCFEDLMLLRMADRKGNKRKNGKSLVTSKQKELQDTVVRLRQEGPVFIEDINLPKKRILELTSEKERLSKISNLLGVLRRHPEKNEEEYVVWFLGKDENE